MPINLNAHQLLPIFLVSLVVILVASEIGRGLGVHARAGVARMLQRWKARSWDCWR